jgi:hypothetical protein
MDFNNYSKTSRFGLLKFEFYNVIVSHVLHYFIISFLATVLAWFTNPDLVYGLTVLFVVVVISYYIMRIKLKKRAILSDQKIIQEAFSDAFREITTFTSKEGMAKSISSKSPIDRIRFEYNLPSLLHLASVFSKALNYLGASKKVFSEDDLGLIRFWIQEDSELRTTLKYLEEIDASSISAFFEVLFSRSFLSDFQRDQLLNTFIDFTGSSSRLDSIQRNIHSKSQEE